MPPVSGERQRAEEFARLLDALEDDLRHGVGASPGDAEGFDVPETGSHRGPAGPGGPGGPGPGAHRGAGGPGGPRHPGGPRVPRQGGDPEMHRMVAAVEQLIAEAQARPIELSAERKAQDIAMLYRMAVENPPSSGKHRGGGTPWKRRLIGGGVAVGVLSGGLGGISWAASKALPGDPLYGVKRGLENMRASVSGSDQARGEQYLDQARTRLGEIRSLLGRHDANVDGSDASRLIAGTMDNLYKDVDSAGSLLVPLAEHGDVQAYTDLTHFLAVYEPQIRDLQTLLAPESQDKATRLLELMQTLDTRMAAAKTLIDKAKDSHGIPGVTVTTAHKGADATAAPSGSAPVGTDHGATGQASGAGGNGPSASPDGGLHIQVPLGSTPTTVVVPPLLSGLPPIGITLGGAAATGPTTGNGAAPNTDPNPN